MSDIKDLYFVSSSFPPKLTYTLFLGCVIVFAYVRLFLRSSIENSINEVNGYDFELPINIYK